MAVHSKLVFSKLLSDTDIKKRLAVPSAIQSSLQPFNGGHALIFHFLHGTRFWPVLYSTRRKGYNKPVFSGRLWRNFVIYNNLNVGDRFTLYRVQVEDGSSYYMVEVGREIDFLGINAMAYGSGSTAEEHVITHHHQAGLSLELSLGQPNVEGADNSKSLLPANQYRALPPSTFSL
ncbi:B3 domain-containing transcription factor NGA4-like [Gossypium australe]|uniref:B3 domain-containing transcription factor NGA4-like n=1 Tax=Gossypium australe TaxID=47621 RepID=A0A5B6V2K7_9ROSI|nr:B3 domain-containing transcription factor NGA4-like [Gossypium australe]